MDKHDVSRTPGPWQIVEYGDGDSLVIHSDRERRVCFMATPGSYGDPEKILADARLIAAAPDLLEALEELLALHVAHHNDPAHVKARAALSKAKGEQP